MEAILDRVVVVSRSLPARQPVNRMPALQSSSTSARTALSVPLPWLPCVTVWPSEPLPGGPEDVEHVLRSLPVGEPGEEQLARRRLARPREADALVSELVPELAGEIIRQRIREIENGES